MAREEIGKGSNLMNNNLERRRTQYIVMTALMSALVMSVTLVTKIDLPIGYLNLGDFAILAIASLMPLRIAIVAAGVGSALADLFGGYPIYAIFTLFIKIFEVLVFYWFSHLLNTRSRIIPFGLAVLSMLLLYGFVDGFLLSSVEAIGVAVIRDLPQALISGTLAFVLYPQYIRIKKYLRGV